MRYHVKTFYHLTTDKLEDLLNAFLPPWNVVSISILDERTEGPYYKCERELSGIIIIDKGI